MASGIGSRRLQRWRTYRSGGEIYLQGRSRTDFSLENGRLDVSIPIFDDEWVTMHCAQPGFWIGESALLSGCARGISVVTHGECLVLAISALPLSRLLEEHLGDYRYFYRLSHANIMQTLHVRAEIIALPPKARFARLLLRLAGADGVVAATQTELGGLAGMSRAAFRRAFSDIIERGVVKTEYGVVRILDFDALHREGSTN